MQSVIPAPQDMYGGGPPGLDMMQPTHQQPLHQHTKLSDLNKMPPPFMQKPAPNSGGNHINKLLFVSNLP